MRMNHVYFEVLGGATLRPHEDYGMLLKSYQADPPEPRMNFVTIEGRDGDVDFSDWTGVIRFDSREVRVSLRDMQGNADTLIAIINGRRVKLWFDDEPRWYYTGRVTGIQTNRFTRHHVTDIDITVTCEPYRLSFIPTRINKTLTAEEQEVLVVPKRMPTSLAITVDGTCEYDVDGVERSYNTSGTHIDTFPITGPTTVTITGNGTAKFVWTDGDF